MKSTIKEEVKISVIICTKNRTSYLKKCLNSLFRQSYLPKEIIIVDDNSDEVFDVQSFLTENLNTLKCTLLKKFFGVNIILVRNKETSGMVASRNVGIKTSSGEVIAFLDDDGFAHKGWLKNLAKNYNDKKIVGVGGPVIEIGRDIKTPKKKVHRLAYIKNGKIISNYRIKKIKDIKYLSRSKVPFLQGGNMSYRRSVLLEINGGDVEFIGNAYREDTDLGLKASKKGTLIFEPKAIAYHDTAMKGGSRDIIKFDINKFLFFQHRNTTYLFFKHFRIRKAAKHTIHAIKTQVLLIINGKTGFTRNYFTISKRRNSLKWVFLGMLSGLFTWFKLKNNHENMSYGKINSLKFFEIVIVGSTIKIIELETKTNLLKKIFGL